MHAQQPRYQPPSYYPPSYYPGSAPNIPVPPRRSNKRLYLIATTAVLAVAGICVGVMAAFGVFSTKTFTMHGSISIIDTNTEFAGITTDGSGCEGTGPYSDLSPGTAVIVQDTTGKVVATGQLESGMGDAGGGICTEPFTVPDVPDGLSAYSVTVSHRGTQVIQPGEAHAGIRLTIGSSN